MIEKSVVLPVYSSEEAPFFRGEMETPSSLGNFFRTPVYAVLLTSVNHLNSNCYHISTLHYTALGQAHCKIGFRGKYLKRKFISVSFSLEFFYQFQFHYIFGYELN